MPDDFKERFAAKVGDEINAGIKAKLSIFEHAKKLLVEKGWTQDEVARDADGHPCDSHSEAAACFCSIGALQRAQKDLMIEGVVSRDDLILSFERVTHIGDLADFNDAEERTEEQVLDQFDIVINKYKEMVK